MDSDIEQPKDQAEYSIGELWEALQARRREEFMKHVTIFEQVIDGKVVRIPVYKGPGCRPMKDETPL